MSAVPEIPVTDKLAPRPVWARYQRRVYWESIPGVVRVDMEPPTEAEKHDAILVLQEAASWPLRPFTLRYGDPSELLLYEAEQIFLDASISHEPLC